VTPLAGDGRAPGGSAIKDFRGSWKNACKAASVVGRIPHDLRRTAVRNLERAGVPRSAAMKMTGHKTEAVYRRYAIAEAAMLREAAVKLAALHAAEASREKRKSHAKVGSSDALAQ
jgi:integrase